MMNQLKIVRVVAYLRSLLVALPIGHLGASRWLEAFPYRIEIGWWMFGLTGFMVLAVALLTVSLRAVKAAVANPVESLRDE